MRKAIFRSVKSAPVPHFIGSFTLTEEEANALRLKETFDLFHFAVCKTGAASLGLDRHTGIAYITARSKRTINSAFERGVSILSERTPFDVGDIIEFSGERYEVVVNYGDSGRVKELGGSESFPFSWEYEGEKCKRVFS